MFFLLIVDRQCEESMRRRFGNWMWIYLLPLVVISLCVLCAYLPALDGTLVLDDIRTIVDNSFIQCLDNFSLPDILTRPRIITDLTFALNYALHGQDPLGYHVVNIVLHILNSFLVFLLIYLFLNIVLFSSADKSDAFRDRNRKVWLSLIAGLSASLFFALHPLQIMAVTYIAQRYTSMAAFFCLLSVGLYMAARMVIGSGTGDYLLADNGTQKMGTNSFLYGRIVGAGLLGACSLFAAVLGFLCKQNAVMLPGLILLVELLVFTRTRSALYTWVCAALFIALFGGGILYIQGILGQELQLGQMISDISQQSMETREVSRWVYLCTQFGVIVHYMALTIVPVGQNIDHMYPFVSGFFDDFTPLYFLVLLAFVVLAAALVRRRPLISLGIGWMFVALSVESGIIPIRDAMFEHRMYLPLLGPSLIFGYLVYLVGTKVQRPLMVLPAAACILVLFGGLTYARNQLWQNPVALWTDSVTKNPENDRAWNNLGKSELERGNIDQAEEYFQKALQINPDNPRAKGNLGYILYTRQEYEKALPYMRQAACALPSSADFQYNLGVLYSELRKSKKAVTYYRKALRLRPDYHQARRNLGVELARQGKMQQAAKTLDKALEHEPENLQVLKNLALIRLKSGQFNLAEELLRRALKIMPRSPGLLTYLGIALYEQGEYGQARKFLLKTININPNNSLAKKYLIKAQQGMYSNK